MRSIAAATREQGQQATMHLDGQQLGGGHEVDLVIEVTVVPRVDCLLDIEEVHEHPVITHGPVHPHLETVGVAVNAPALARVAGNDVRGVDRSFQMDASVDHDRRQSSVQAGYMLRLVEGRSPHSVDESSDSGPPRLLASVASRVLDAIETSAAGHVWTWSEPAFNELAVSVFRAQYGTIPAYRDWCDHELAERGVDAACVMRWQDVPALPIAAFKQRRVAAHQPAADVAEWRSSGTTGAQTSIVALPDLALYEASLRAGARAALLPDPAMAAPLAIQLVPDADDAPGSSLSHMLEVVRTQLCSDGGTHADSDGRVDADGAWTALADASRADTPTLVLATSFALVDLLERADAAGLANLVLAPGSRLMDTGGYKGRTRELTREQLLDAVSRRLGIAPAWCENEYGMCELATQAWLGTIASASGLPLPGWSSDAAGRRWQPPWMRTRVVDPVTLEQVEDGEQGLLVHHDLANVWTCAAIRSEDVGVRMGSQWRLVGRAPGAQLRGCSLQLEDVW